MTDLSKFEKRYDCWNEVRWSYLGDGSSHLFGACKEYCICRYDTAYKKCGNVTSGKHNSGRKRKLTDRDKSLNPHSGPKAQAIAIPDNVGGE
ncbi:hypothetical protein TNCV_3651481 [Trichonephila clavipes]|nr:hypothetical protein TNCV_3651481 [Trichonephila clavipes]